MTKNYKTISMKLKLSKGELEVVRHISKKPKSMYNKAISNIKKHYIKNIVQENNQKFNTIPFGKIKNRLNYLSNLHGINFIIQEESYTSDKSFLDTDDITIYKKEDTNVYTFLVSKELKLGKYITKNNIILNASVFGALNIL